MQVETLRAEQAEAQRNMTAEALKIEQACGVGIGSLKEGLMDSFSQFNGALQRVGDSAALALVAERQVIRH